MRSKYLFVLCLSLFLLAARDSNSEDVLPAENYQSNIKIFNKEAGTNPGDETLFSMEFRDAELKDIFRAIGQEYGLNLIIGDGVEGKVTLSFQKVSLTDLFNVLLKSHNLTSFKEANIIRIEKIHPVEMEEEFITEIIPINFANAKDISESIKNMLSKKGNISIDIRTNNIIVRDSSLNLNKIREIVKDLDTKTPQILIEARIIEANTNFTKELGVQWGGNLLNRSSIGIAKLGGGANQTTSSSSPLPQTGAVGMSGNNFLVNLPAKVGSGSGGALGFTFGNLANTMHLDLQLSALEDTGKGRILSNPKIMTLDNKEARISSGTEIIVQTATIVGGGSTSGSGGSGGGTTTGVTTIDAKLELLVIPHVTHDNQIVLHVKTDKKDPDFNRQVQGIPPLTTKTAETDLLVKDGETVVIGGIYTKNDSVGEQGVPWFSRIPFLGWLFKKEITTNNQNELIIFITPTVIKG